MEWRSAGPAHQFRPVDQVLTLDQVAESCRTRRVKEGICGSASISAAFRHVGRIQMGIQDYHLFRRFAFSPDAAAQLSVLLPRDILPC
jgi:hypothetical protein